MTRLISDPFQRSCWSAKASRSDDGRAARRPLARAVRPVLPRGQQLLTIANEMNRTSKLLAAGDVPRLRNAYERVLALADLTIAVNPSRSLRRELLPSRDLVAEQYVAETPDPAAHAAAFRALLQLHPETWQQLPYVTGAASRAREPSQGSAGG